MSSCSACWESWFGRKTTKHLLRPQVGGVLGNEVPGRVPACQDSWLSCSSTTQSQNSCGVIQGLILLVEQWVPAVLRCWWAAPSPRGLWFVLWLLLMRRFWHGVSRIMKVGLPPYVCGGFIYIYIKIYACALVCCKSNMLPLLCWPELPCLLLFLSRLSVLSWHLAPYPEDCESFGEKPSVCLASAPLRRVMLIPCTWSCDALENPPRRGPLGCSWD